MSNATQSPAEPKAATPIQSTGGLGALSVHEVYPLPVFKQRSGLSGWALRAARRAGLRVVKVGRRSYVRGSDFADYLDRVASTAAADS